MHRVFSGNSHGGVDHIFSSLGVSLAVGSSFGNLQVDWQAAQADAIPLIYSKISKRVAPCVIRQGCPSTKGTWNLGTGGSDHDALSAFIEVPL